MVVPSSSRVLFVVAQRYGPPAAYPNLRIPGLNAPLPEGASFGYHPGACCFLMTTHTRWPVGDDIVGLPVEAAGENKLCHLSIFPPPPLAGGWGKPPVNEFGQPLYGDVFGTVAGTAEAAAAVAAIDKTRWGEMADDEEEEDSDEEEDEGDDDDDGQTDATGMATPLDSGMSSVTSGIDSTGASSVIDLRKRAGMETPDTSGIDGRVLFFTCLSSGGRDAMFGQRAAGETTVPSISSPPAGATRSRRRARRRRSSTPCSASSARAAPPRPAARARSSARTRREIARAVLPIIAPHQELFSRARRHIHTYIIYIYTYILYIIYIFA